MTQPDVLLKQAREFIAASRKVLADGGDVELSGLEQMIGSLCGTIGGMSKEAAKHYEQSLQSLVSDLGVLEQELKTQRDIIKDKLSKVNPAKDAVMAYKKAGSLEGGAKKDDKEEE